MIAASQAESTGSATASGRRNAPRTRTGQLCADAALTCHDQAVATLSEIADHLDAVMDLMGPVIGVVVLAVGIQTYRDGGSAGWPLAGAALLMINLLVAWRRLSRRRRPDASA